MAITWQSVSTPNFSDSNQLAVAGGENTRLGIESISRAASGIGERQAKKENAKYEKGLLNILMDTSLNEKQVQAKALKMGLDEGRSAEQVMGDMTKVGGIAESLNSLSADQQAVIEGYSSKAAETELLGQQAIANTLAQYDLQNPQLVQTEAQYDLFTKEGGVGPIMDKVLSGIEDSKNRELTRQAFIDFRNKNPEYDDFAFGLAMQEYGVEHKNLEGWVDRAKVDTKEFKKVLDRNQKKVIEMRRNAETRVATKARMDQDLYNAIQAIKKQQAEEANKMRQENKKIFQSL